jgi:hypothetical protein
MKNVRAGSLAVMAAPAWAVAACRPRGAAAVTPGTAPASNETLRDTCGLPYVHGTTAAAVFYGYGRELWMQRAQIEVHLSERTEIKP